ncbi:hypothetical protein AMTR_s00019p00248210 [Amborella trichopoda]|uniref:Uncharacterized protein n=1 Tax=Amborella trichopoda TaxID=13333 RepID=W1PI68_AMBTC|nr:hypothetical protein AMTR_s00019p00248210 [Amborella trichopoda]
MKECRSINCLVSWNIASAATINRTSVKEIRPSRVLRRQRLGRCWSANWGSSQSEHCDPCCILQQLMSKRLDIMNDHPAMVNTKLC